MLKKIIPILLIMFLLLQCVSAEKTLEDISNGKDFGQKNVKIDIKDKYLINDTSQLEGKIKIKNDKKYNVHSYIDYRNIETEADSGGYVDDDEYILPHDLGLGSHKISFIFEDDEGNYVSKVSYDFYVLKNIDDDLKMYEGYTPYYYTDDIDDDFIEEDYNEYKWLYEFGENNFINDIFEDDDTFISVNNDFMKVNVNLGTFDEIDDSLTSVEI